MREAPGIRRQIPNVLTVARLLLAAIVFVLLGSILPNAFNPLSDLRNDATQTLLLAAAVFVVAALTDAADGYLARRWDAVTAFGRVMDPFADKILILGTGVLIVSPPFIVYPPVPLDPETGTRAVTSFMLLGFEAWMVVALLARELLVTSLRGVYEARGVSFPSVWSGKVKMILQSIGLPAVMVLAAVTDVDPGTSGRQIVVGIAWATTLVTAWSGVPYVVAAIRHELERDDHIGDQTTGDQARSDRKTASAPDADEATDDTPDENPGP